MKLIEVSVDELVTTAELSRSGRSKAFEDRLRSSIDEIGIVEPLKVAMSPDGGHIVIDGNLRLRAIRGIRDAHSDRYEKVAAYLLSYDQRYEIRYQSDIYQDLLPSQLATLVEHLHRAENVRKGDIARYIGVSPATLRNYTGLWRLLERDGLFARIVDLMDVGLVPASNPYAWLRLTSEGLRKVLVEYFADGEDPEIWVASVVKSARVRGAQRYPLKFVESVTASLPADCYRVDEEVRAVKRDLGLRRSRSNPASATMKEARRHLADVSSSSHEPVLRSAANAFQEYLA